MCVTISWSFFSVFNDNNTIVVTNDDDILDIDNGLLLEKIAKFHYLGEMFSANVGCDVVVTARFKNAWKKFREYLPILTGKGFFGKVYTSCVRSCLMYGKETRLMKMEHEVKLDRTEMSMIRWMCGLTLKDRKKNAEFRELFGWEPVSLVIKKGSLRWFDTLNVMMMLTGLKVEYDRIGRN